MARGRVADACHLPAPRTLEGLNLFIKFACPAEDAIIPIVPAHSVFLLFLIAHLKT